MLKKWWQQRRGREVKTRHLPEDLWDKCPSCHQLVYRKELESNLQVCPKCQYHYRLTARERIAITADPGSWRELDAQVLSANPLDFPEYEAKLGRDQQRLQIPEAILTGYATIEGWPALLGVMDFHFRGGSMGCVVGEKVTRLMERAVAEHKPLILFCASGGARMQEGLLSLMQMAKTSAAAGRLNQAGVPYITVLTDPTTAGVLASFAFLGDIILAEPQAVVGFTGPRVIEQSYRLKLPPNFQKAEFQLEHGMIDAIVPRPQLRSTLALLLRFSTDQARVLPSSDDGREPVAAPAEEPQPEKVPG
ncbi:MAG TPA: acetyl-CoA carboxylase carboxyltransferase subunit beta [Armatimonadetes bacterium]|nr:acetyl-CoA carboxylase carboxyltransferase subunit beta [Armatimonadota bacterium]